MGLLNKGSIKQLLVPGLAHVCLLGTALSCTSPAFASGVIVTEGVPEGFEDFFDPQTTVVDVFYGGVYLVSTLATYTPESIQFDIPEEVSEQLDNLLNPSLVATLLQQPLEPNQGLVCYDQDQEDCGMLTPDEVGVIFDDGRFRVDLFINPALLAVQESLPDKYLPPATTDFSYISNLAGTLSGSNEGDNFSLQGVSYFSKQEQRVNAIWNIDNDDGAAVTRLFWQRDEQDHQYQAGWFSSNSRYLDFVGTVELLGVSYSTSLNSRTDLESVRGTPLQVFLSTRSRVNLIRDGRIVSSNFYGAGNQLLNTSALPEGAYEVEIQIIDLSGREQVIRRFYSKTPRIPPSGQDLYFVEAGDVTRIGRNVAFPESESAFTIRGGFSRRVKDNLGVDVAGAFAESEAVVESGLYYLESNYSLQPKLMLSTGGDVGLSLISFARYGLLSSSYSLRSIWSDNHEDTSGDYRLITGALMSHNVSINYPIAEGQLSFNASINRQGDEPEDSTYSLSYDRGLYKHLFTQLDLTSELTISDDDSLFLIRLNWRQTKNRLTHNAFSSIRTEDNEQRDTTFLRAGYNASWNDGDLYPNDLTSRVDVSVDRFNQRLGGEVAYRADIGRARLALEHQIDSENNLNTTSYVGSFATNIAGEQKAYGWGGEEASQAGVLLSVEGDVEDTFFDVIINKRQQGQAKAGKTTFIPLSPYETYDVQLKDRGTRFIAFDDKPRQITLYPGNVESFIWSADSLKVVIGRLVRMVPDCVVEEGVDIASQEHCWKPVSNAQLQGVHGWASTDEFGYFQAEVKQSVNQIVAKRKDFNCHANLPNYTSEDGLVYLEDDLHCLSTVPVEPDPEPEVVDEGCTSNINRSSVNPDQGTRLIHYGKGC